MDNDLTVMHEWAFGFLSAKAFCHDRGWFVLGKLNVFKSREVALVVGL